MQHEGVAVVTDVLRRFIVIAGAEQRGSCQTTRDIASRAVRLSSLPSLHYRGERLHEVTAAAVLGIACLCNIFLFVVLVQMRSKDVSALTGGLCAREGGMLPVRIRTRHTGVVVIHQLISAMTTRGHATVSCGK